MAAPTEWSRFIYPPQNSRDPLLEFNTQDAVNVSWTTPGNNTEFFDTLELIFWWNVPANGPDFAEIVNETVSLNGSRIFSTGYGGTFPAIGFFALFYLQIDGTVVNGPASLGFNISNTNPSVKGRLWSEDPADISLSNSSAQSTTLPSATTATVTVATQGPSPTSANTTTTSPNSSTASGLSSGAVAGLVIGVAAALCLLFLGIIFSMRRRRQKQLQYVPGSHLGEKPPHLRQPVYPTAAPVETDGRQRSELPAGSRSNRDAPTESTSGTPT